MHGVIEQWNTEWFGQFSLAAGMTRCLYCVMEHGVQLLKYHAQIMFQEKPIVILQNCGTNKRVGCNL